MTGLSYLNIDLLIHFHFELRSHQLCFIYYVLPNAHK